LGLIGRTSVIEISQGLEHFIVLGSKYFVQDIAHLMEEAPLTLRLWKHIPQSIPKAQRSIGNH
jgi:hypothetical protein